MAEHAAEDEWHGRAPASFADGNLVRQAAVLGNSYDFTIAEGTLTLAVGDGWLNTSFTKVGD